MRPDPSLAHLTCSACGEPAYPHPYRHAVALAAPIEVAEHVEHRRSKPLPAHRYRLHLEVGTNTRRQLAAALREIAHVLDNDPSIDAPEWALTNSVVGGMYRADGSKDTR